MPVVDVDKLRNVVLLSHSGAGKTSLCEALLFTTKETTRLGNVEDGNTVSDYEPEEVKRSSSIQTTVIPCNWDGTKGNLLDTPGYDDFLGEDLCALRVAEGAVLLVAAPSGIEVGTERAWDLCQQRKLPRLVFVNKMDRDNADFHRTLGGLQDTFGRKCVPLQIPIGSQQSFKGVIDLLNVPAEVPSELAQEVREARERLVEAVAETDDELATRYLEGEEISGEELVQALRNGVLAGEFVPVLAGSATGCIGVEELLVAMANYLPSPKEAGTIEASSQSSQEAVDVEPAADGPLAALVFKTTADPFVGKLSYFRVYRGTFRSNSEVWNASKGQSERVGQLYSPRGKNQDPVPEIGAGDIGAVAKLADTVTNDSLCKRDQPITFEPTEFPRGNYTMGVFPKTKADVDKMSTALSRIVEEDPSLHLFREPDTGETLLSGLGDTHLDVTLDKIRRKFGTDLTLQLPLVPYKETITTVTQAEYKHKKQTGGHGQYGHVMLRLEPQEKGSGFQFGAEVVGGSVPKEYIPSVEKGVTKTLQEGVVAGYPVVNLRVVLYDGSYHDVDSSGISFEIAGSHAVRQGVSQGNPSLLEPIMKLSVRVPDSFTGDIMGDLNGKRGRILGMNPEGSFTTIEADVPQAELLRYSTELRSMTQGRGSYTGEFSRYEAVPFNIAQKIIDEAKKEKEEARA